MAPWSASAGRVDRHQRWPARVPLPVRGGSGAGGGAASARRCCVRAERESTAAAASIRPTGRGSPAASPTSAQMSAPTRCARRMATTPARWFFDMKRPPRRRAGPSAAAARRDRGADRSRETRTGHLARRQRGLPRPLGRDRRVRGGVPRDRTRPTSIRRSGSSPGTVTRSPGPSINTIYHEDNEALGLQRGWLDSCSRGDRGAGAAWPAR